MKRNIFYAIGLVVGILMVGASVWWMNLPLFTVGWIIAVVSFFLLEKVD
mgnify:CR=1 FL=1